ncbi:MAG: exodeoxyribonuclease VII large subunit [Actinobacteria bacterium]|nr:exodeoxyribonuclease VII large subunit [Actinomycetota bacterium]
MLETSIDSPAPVRVVSEAIKEWIGKLGPIWVEGELSQVDDRKGSTMIFMRLRDTSAEMSISVSCHRSVFAAVAPLPANARIKVFSKVNFYTGNGSLSLNAREIHHVGIGELLARLEALKKILAAEGLFAASRKKVLPFLPRRIGLICGRNSAAEKDVVENARRRWPAVEFEIREVAVQGASAVSEVSKALKELDDHDEVDVIIITRGGGSFEDLLPFSDEGLVRLVAACKKPVVSAIGHEQDTPLIDLVADFRASTPTDAAKRVVPDIAEENKMLGERGARLLRAIKNLIDGEVGEVKGLASRPIMRDPKLLVIPLVEDLSTAKKNLRQEIRHLIELTEGELTQSVSQLRALSPRAVLNRGYAVVQRSDGNLVRSYDEIPLDSTIWLRFARGSATATVRATSEVIEKPKS